VQEDVLSESAIRRLLNLQIKGQSTKVRNVSIEQILQIIALFRLIISQKVSLA